MFFINGLTRIHINDDDDDTSGNTDCNCDKYWTSEICIADFLFFRFLFVLLCYSASLAIEVNALQEMRFFICLFFRLIERVVNCRARFSIEIFHWEVIFFCGKNLLGEVWCSRILTLFSFNLKLIYEVKECFFKLKSSTKQHLKSSRWLIDYVKILIIVWLILSLKNSRKFTKIKIFINKRNAMLWCNRHASVILKSKL